MKGLLIKDLKLLLGQKVSLFMIFAIGVLFVFANQDVSFAVTYTTMVATIWAMGSISYDNLDNGMAFLMTLPIKRKTYVLEKYVYVYLLSGFIGGVTSILSFFLVYPKELVIPLLIAIYMVLFMSAIMLPINLKFGAEKARIVLFIVFGVIVGCAYIIGNILPQKAYSTFSLEKLSIVQVLGLGGVIAVVITVISILISIKVMENKEF